MALGKHTLHLLSCCMEIVLALHENLAVTDKQMELLYILIHLLGVCS